MATHNAAEKWIESGYELFAKEGPGGIQVERLARIVDLNKSGFYHYFSDMENFSRQLIVHHHRMIDFFLEDAESCKNIDPDYLNMLVKHKVIFMCQIQLVHHKNNNLFFEAHKDVDERIAHFIQKIWIKHTDITTNPKLAFQYFCLVRDMVYARVNWRNLTFDYMHSIADESKDIVKKMFEEGERHHERVHSGMDGINSVV